MQRGLKEVYSIWYTSQTLAPPKQEAGKPVQCVFLSRQTSILNSSSKSAGHSPFLLGVSQKLLIN